MIRADILTPYKPVTVDGTQCYHFELGEDYPIDSANGEESRCGYRVVAKNIPTAPNLISVIAVYDEATMALIRADNKYYIQSEETV